MLMQWKIILPTVMAGALIVSAAPAQPRLAPGGIDGRLVFTPNGELQSHEPHRYDPTRIRLEMRRDQVENKAQ
jgi:hypothetical protein